MKIYIAKKILNFIPTFIGATFLVFMLLYASPSPPHFSWGPGVTPEMVHEWIELHGLNDPLMVRYFNYMRGLLRGDLGISFWRNMSITSEVMARFPYTLRLGLSALFAALLLAIPVGIISAIKRNTWIDKLIKSITSIGISIPVMWLGMLLVLFQIRFTSWSPSSDHFWFARWPMNVILITTIGAGMFAAMARDIRFAMLNALKHDYLQTARAKGISRVRILRKHVFRNALVHALRTLKTHMGTLFTGVIIVEHLFAFPGIWRFMFQGILTRDYPLIMGCLVMFILIYAALNFIIDIAAAILDPRIRTQHKSYIM